MTSEQLLSKSFDFLRFPLIVGVVFIHSFDPKIANSLDISQLGGVEYPLYYVVANFFSQILGRVAVPLFFFISGYLFFYKIETFNKNTYLVKLRKRVRSLLIPYLFWNLFFIIIYMLLLYCPITSGFFNTENINNYSFNIDTVSKILIGQRTDNPVDPELYPFASQFWFIRDLICCVLISPILFYIVTKTKWYGVSLLGILWLAGCNLPYIGTRGLSITSLFFFSAGAWFSTRKLNIVNIMKDFKVIFFVYPIWVVLELVSLKNSYHQYIHNFGIILGIIFCFVLTAYLLEEKGVKPIPFLSASSFFLFAIHQPILLPQIKKILKIVINSNTDLAFCVSYLLMVATVIICALFIYKTLQKLSPKILNIMTGGR